MELQKRVVIYASTIVLFAMVLATIKRNYVWASEKTLWQDVVDKSPKSPTGHINLARDYHLSGNSKVAIAEYQEAMKAAAAQLNRDGSDFRARDILVSVQTNLAALMFASGDEPDAELTLNGALRLMPHFGPADIMLSELYLKQRRYMQAISLADAALDSRAWGPSFHDAGQFYVIKGMALCGIGNRTDANLNFDAAVKADRTIEPGVCK